MAGENQKDLCTNIVPSDTSPKSVSKSGDTKRRPVCGNRCGRAFHPRMLRTQRHVSTCARYVVQRPIYRGVLYRNNTDCYADYPSNICL